MKLASAIVFVLACAFLGGAVVIGYAWIQETGSPYPEGILGLIGLLLGFLSLPGIVINQLVFHADWFGVIAVNAASYGVLCIVMQVCRRVLRSRYPGVGAARRELGE